MSSQSQLGGDLPNDQGKSYDARKPSSTSLAAAGVLIGPPASTRWKLYHILIKFVASATVGTRLILVYMTDNTTAPVSGTEGANVVIEWVNSGTIGTGRSVTAGVTERYEISAMMASDASATIFKALAEPPNLSAAGFQIFIQDTAAIDPAGDKVTIETIVEEWIEL